MPEVRVVIVDDSTIVRRLLKRLVEDERGFTVVGEAQSGADAVTLAVSLRPDIILMDLTMPGGDGITALARIMAKAPTRVIVVTSVVRYGGQNAVHAALEHGAVELVSKNDVLADDGKRFRERLRALAQARVQRQTPEAAPAPVIERRKLDVVVVGASAGGPSALRELVKNVSPTFPASLVLAQHMPDEFSEAFVTWIRASARVPVHEAQAGMTIERGEIYVLVRGPHLKFGTRGVLAVATDATETAHVPAIDPLFVSAAEVYGARAAGILLTGMGRDGALGLLAMRERGALTIAEHESSATVDGMPRAARELKAASRVMTCDDVAGWIATLT